MVSATPHAEPTAGGWPATGDGPSEVGPQVGGGSSGAASGDATGDLESLAWTPVSPRLVTARRLGLLWTLLPLLVVVVAGAVLTRSPFWAVPALAWLALAVWLWGLQARAVRAIGYLERADDLLVRRGVLFRSLVVVPYGRMQYVDVIAGPVDRWLGIATVQLHTASAGTDAAVPGLTPHDAARLRERLARRGEARMAGL